MTRKDLVTHDREGRKVYLPALPKKTPAQRAEAQAWRKAQALAQAQELLRKAQAEALASPVKAKEEEAPAFTLPLEAVKDLPAYWEALQKYVRAAVSRKLWAAVRSDNLLQTDAAETEAITPANSPNTLALVTYWHNPRPEDVDDTTQAALLKAWECWGDWQEKVIEALEAREEGPALGLHMARYIARRAVYLHWQAQAKLQKQGLLGPDFWHIVPDTRPEGEYSLLVNRIAWADETDADCLALLDMLAEGYSHAEACQGLGIATKTGRRWLNSLAEALKAPAWEVYSKAPAWAVVSAGPVVSSQAKAQRKAQAKTRIKALALALQELDPPDTSAYWQTWRTQEGAAYIQAQGNPC